MSKSFIMFAKKLTNADSNDLIKKARKDLESQKIRKNTWPHKVIVKTKERPNEVRKGMIETFLLEIRRRCSSSNFMLNFKEKIFN